MRKEINLKILSLFFSVTLSLMLPKAYGQSPKVETKSKPQTQSEVIQLNPNDVTPIVASRGSLSGNLQGNVKGNNVVTGFNTPQDKVTFTVNVPKEDDYEVGVLFSLKGQQNIEIRSGESVLLAPSMLRTWEYRPFFWRQEMPGLLHLKAGLNQISFRLPNAQPVSDSSLNKKTKFGEGVTEDFYLFSIELGKPADRKAQYERAKNIRGDASWMVKGKYGLFVHFSAMSFPYEGNERRAAWFQKSVEMFDVKVFADAVEQTGAAWVTLTVTHQGFYWPGPNAALDKILPGRTTKRDLIGEIIDELGKRGIRTLLYMHTGYNGYETEFRKAAGADDVDKKRFSDNIEAILRDCSLRYGKKLSGFSYLDGALSWDYPLNPYWEGWARAIKAGNPDALVGFSSNRGPSVSPFSELAVTDGGSDLRQPDSQIIGLGKQLSDVTPAWWCLMDQDGWFANKPMNGQISRGPVHSTEEYVAFFKRMSAAKIPVTINLIMTADVTNKHPIFNPQCISVMEEVRKAVRGK